MRDTGILIKNFADPFPKKNIVFTGVSISGAHLFFFLLAMILWNALSVSIKWNFWNSIMLINVFLLKKCTRKQCPVLVEKGLLHSFLFSLFYGTILEKEDCVLMKPDIEKLREKYINNPPEGMTSADIRQMSEEELLDMDYFLNEDIFDDEFAEEDFFLF